MPCPTHLPYEVWSKIASRARSYKDVCALSQTARYLRPLSTDDRLHVSIVHRQKGAFITAVFIIARMPLWRVRGALAHLKSMDAEMDVNKMLKIGRVSREQLECNVLGATLHLGLTTERMTTGIDAFVSVGGDVNASAYVPFFRQPERPPLFLAAMHLLPSRAGIDVMSALIAHGAGASVEELDAIWFWLRMKRSFFAEDAPAATREERVARRVAIQTMNDALSLIRRRRSVVVQRASR